MSKAESNSRWYAPWRQASSGEFDDAADLGTAFGLDLSVASEFAHSAEAPLERTPAAPREGWIKRWTQRGRSSD
jgi:hypothetical protein